MNTDQRKQPKFLYALVATIPLWTALLYVLSTLASRVCLDNVSSAILVFLGLVPLIATVVFTTYLLWNSDKKR